jgi:energy-coupling factor transporter transmembrane protein EcfT
MPFENRCLIHNAHLAKPKFLQNFRHENNTLKKIVDLYFCLISAIVIKGWYSNIKTIILLYIILGTSQEKISKTYAKNASELCE